MQNSSQKFSLFSKFSIPYSYENKIIEVNFSTNYKYYYKVYKVKTLSVTVLGVSSPLPSKQRF